MDDDEQQAPDLEAFVAFLREEESKAEDTWLDQDRANAIEFYNGEPFGDEEDGRSQVVTRDVAEVVDQMVISLLRTMVSGDKVVEFDYSDREVAEQATAAVMQEFYQGQDGYRFLHDWIKAGLLEKTSVAKVCVEAQPPKRIEQQVSAIDLAMMAEQGIQPIAAEEQPDGSWVVAIQQPQPPKFRDYVVPNEEVRIATDARDLDDYCPYLGFAQELSLSALAKRGFDVDDLGNDDGRYGNDPLSQARNPNQGLTTNSTRGGPNRTVWYLEEYSLFDLNGDGIAELILSHRVGNTILRKEEAKEEAEGAPENEALAIEVIDEQPGVVWCPFPMQHRIVGQSLADKVMDIQRTRSVLMRQALDNLYQSNAPRMWVHEDSIGDSTIDDLLTIRPGGLVRSRGAMKPEPIAVPFVAGEAFTAMEILAGEKESRTGVTRMNQGLDADALSKTATGTALMQAAGQQVEEYLARNFAEAFARLCLKKYRLMRRFGSPMQLVIDGESVTIDPRQWPEDMNVRVRVGLGTGRKDERLAHRLTMLELMAAAKQQGMRFVTEDGAYNMMKGVIEDASLGSVRDYLTDPATLGPAEQQPDPKALEVQAKAMIEAEKVKADDAKAQREHEARVQQMQVDAALKQQQLDYDLQAKREKAMLDEQLARDKANFEADLARQQADREFALALRKMEQDRELASQTETADLPEYRAGGELDQ